MGRRFSQGHAVLALFMPVTARLYRDRRQSDGGDTRTNRLKIEAAIQTTPYLP